MGQSYTWEESRVGSGDRVVLMKYRELIKVLMCLISPKVTCVRGFGNNSSERLQVKAHGSKAPLLGSWGIRLFPPTPGRTNN